MLVASPSSPFQSVPALSLRRLLMFMRGYRLASRHSRVCGRPRESIGVRLQQEPAAREAPVGAFQRRPRKPGQANLGKFCRRAGQYDAEVSVYGAVDIQRGLLQEPTEVDEEVSGRWHLRLGTSFFKRACHRMPRVLPILLCACLADTLQIEKMFLVSRSPVSVRNFTAARQFHSGTVGGRFMPVAWPRCAESSLSLSLLPRCLCGS
eukprot:3035893-Amphidinium_carterae.1